MNLQKHFLKEKSFENYDDTSILELLLSNGGVRGDIPKMIDSLYDSFGSFKGILEARPVQLMKVPHVTQKAAALIAMVAPLAKVWERCNMQNPDRIMNRHDAKKYCKSLLMGERTEKFYVISLNARLDVLGAKRISEGSLSEVSAYPRLVVEAALTYNAHSVLFCHNHPGGSVTASAEDVQSTIQLQRLLNSMGILVLDHFIVAGSSTYSMSVHGDVDFRMRGVA